MSKLKFIFLFLLVSFSASSILNAHSTEASTQAEYAKESITNETNQQSDKKEITGNITDEYGEPLIGATVGIQGTSLGTITDYDGNFKLKVSSGDMLKISYLGYNDQEVKVTDKNQYAIVMTISAISLGNDVIITALGIKREKKALSYNAQEVRTDDLTDVKDANFINALSGKVAGVTINASSSGVGGASKVVMRGAKSIGQSNTAMYVIDGVPMYTTGGSGGTEFDSRGGTSSVADINPEDIESMTVLNGASASALYGSEAANGVIMITTKKGKAGKISLTFNQNTEFLSPFVLPKFQNSYGTGTNGVNNSALDNSWGARLNSANNYGYNPKDDYFQTGVVTTEALTLSVGSELNQTFVSLAALNSEGYVPNNTYDRLNFSFRNTTSLLNDRLKLDLGATYIKQKDNNMTNQGIYQNPLISAYLFPRGGDWNNVKMYEQWDTSRYINTQRWDYGLTEFNAQNPYWINYRNLRSESRDRYTMNIGVNYTVLSWLSLSGRAKTDFVSGKEQEKLYATSNLTLTDGSNNGYYAINNFRERQSYADILANISTAFLEDNLTLNVNMGSSISDTKSEAAAMEGALADDAIPNVFQAMQINRDKLKPTTMTSQDQVQSIFASAELGYLGTYYLTLTGRNDWPSQLAGRFSSTSSFFYPSVGTSVVLSEALKLPEQINYLKMRASFANVGTPFKRALATRYHLWDESLRIYNPNYNHFPITNLKPERTKSWELGITAKLFNNFSLDVSLYTTDTYNQVFESNISATSGYEIFYIQGGKVNNKGIEMSLGYDNTFGNVTWSSNYVFSANKNKIVDLIGNWKNPITGEAYPNDYIIYNAYGDTKFILKNGGSLGDLYSLTDLKRDNEGNIYVDANGNVTKEDVSSNPVKLGSVHPKANMSWRNDLSWNNFNLGFMVSARLGGIVYSSTQAVLDSYGVSEASANARDNGGVLVNGTDRVNAESWYKTIGTTSNVAQYYTYNATNVRLQEVSLSYTFSKAKLWNVGDLTVSLIGRNLWMIYNKAPFDPESIASTGNYYQGIDNFMMPSNRSLGFNVKMKF